MADCRWFPRRREVGGPQRRRRATSRIAGAARRRGPQREGWPAAGVTLLPDSSGACGPLRAGLVVRRRFGHVSGPFGAGEVAPCELADDIGEASRIEVPGDHVAVVACGEELVAVGAEGEACLAVRVL